GGDSAPGGDRTQFDLVGRFVFQGRRKAVGVVDARLLRHADLGLRLAVIAADVHERRQGRHAGRAGRGARGAAGAHEAGGCRIIDAHGPARRVVVDELAVERRVLVLGHVVGQKGREVVAGLEQRRHAGARAIEVVPAVFAGLRIGGGRVLVLNYAVDLEGDVG